MFRDFSFRQRMEWSWDFRDFALPVTGRSAKFVCRNVR